MAAPFIVSALIVFGASGFGDFTDSVEESIPLPSLTEILGVDNEFTDSIVGLVEEIYDLIEEGAQEIVDLVLDIPDDGFDSAMIAQFSGCVATLFFMVCLCGNVYEFFVPNVSIIEGFHRTPFSLGSL